MKHTSSVAMYCFRTLIIVVIVVGYLPLRGQTDRQQHLLDTLEQYPLRDSTYVNWMNQLAGSYWYVAPGTTDSLARIALDLSLNISFEGGVLRSYYNLALAQWMLGDYPLAFEYISEQLKIAEDRRLRAHEINAYALMALITEDQGLFHEALDYHRLVLDYKLAAGDSLGISSSLNNMGSVYWQLNQLDSSLMLFQRAYDIREALGAKNGMRESLSNIGYILNEQGKPQEALPIIKKTLAQSYEMNNPTGVVNNQETLGNIYVNLGRLDSAEYIYLQALQGAREMGVNKRIIDITGQLAKLYELRKDYPKAYTYLETYWTLKDSIEGQEAATRLSRLREQYQNERQELKIMRLEQQNQVNLNLRNLFAIGTLGALILAFIIYRFFRYRQRKNLELLEAQETQTKQLEEINQLKSRFLANLSHEFRTPLTLILGPAEKLLANKTDGPEKQQLSWIYQNSRKLLKLINQLLDLSKVEAGKLELKTGQQDLVNFCRFIVSAFNSLAEQKQVQLQFRAPKEPLFVYFDPEKLEQVLNNLLINAFKFTEEGRIILSLETKEEEGRELVRIAISDSGTGIHAQQLPYIFDRFYQASQESPSALEGTGIGLALCKELIELHSGSIRVESELGKGTSFYIHLPLGRSHLKDEEITRVLTGPAAASPELQVEPLIAEKAMPTDNSEQPLLLLVDDNRDMLDYIQLQLEGHYRFIRAANGREALEHTREELPDLIISDIMMPGMDGYEFCSAVKNDPATDHIPIILLTARVGESYKIRGLEIQADDYIQKPFNQQELKARVHNLILNRKKLQQRYGEISLLEVPKLSEHPGEAKFLQQLLDVVEEQIMNPQLDVSSLAKIVGMSKSQLNRKAKTILGKTPNQFIRSYRLEKARQMIKSTDLTLAEIAYDVGFSSPAYFSKCFHDEFGYPPSTIS